MPVAPTRERFWRALRQRRVMTLNGRAAGNETSETAPVVTSHGDPDGVKPTALAFRCPAQPGDFVSLADPAAIGAAVA